MSVRSACPLSLVKSAVNCWVDGCGEKGMWMLTE